MGLFGLFKSKKGRKEDVAKQLSEAQDIGSMLTVLAKNNIISAPKDKYHNSFGEDITHLTADGELPWGWTYANRDFTEPVKTRYNYLLSEYINAKKQEKGIRVVYSALKSFILYMEDVKRICEAKGECFVEWSKISICNEASMAGYKEDLKNIEENMDDLIKKENIIKQLRPELLKIIRDEPGVVQASLYKRFDPELKFEIQNQLYLLWSRDIIIREKSGRSYKLFLKQK